MWNVLLRDIATVIALQLISRLSTKKKYGEGSVTVVIDFI